MVSQIGNRSEYLFVSSGETAFESARGVPSELLFCGKSVAALLDSIYYRLAYIIIIVQQKVVNLYGSALSGYISIAGRVRALILQILFLMRLHTCHDLAPWYLTLTTTSQPGIFRKMPRPCAVGVSRLLLSSNERESRRHNAVASCDKNYCAGPKRKRYSAEFMKPLTIVRESPG